MSDGSGGSEGMIELASQVGSSQGWAWKEIEFFVSLVKA